MPQPTPRRPTYLRVAVHALLIGTVASVTLTTLTHCGDPEPPPVPDEPTPVAAPVPAPAPAPAPESLIAVYELAAPNGGVESDIGAQRIAIADGARLWTEDHQRMVSVSAYHERRPVAVSDGSGGVIAVYDAEVPEGPLRGDLDLLAQRLDADGALLWGGGVQSVVLAATDVVETQPHLLADGSGGAFLVFERHGFDEQGAIDSDLAAQRLGPDGSLRWAEGDPAGFPVAAGAGLATHAALAPDGADGVVVVYLFEPTQGPGAGLHQIWAQRLDAEGRPLWGQNGQPVPVASAHGALGAPVLLPSGDGGVLVVFQEEAIDDGRPGDLDLMVQRIAPDGSLPWSGSPEGYKVVSATLLAEGAPAVVGDGEGGAIVAFAGTWLSGPRSGEADLFAQRIGADGRGLWNDGAPVAVASSSLHEGDPLLVSDGAGGAIAIYEQRPPAAHLSKDQDLGAQRISAQGSLLWHGGQQSAVVSATTHLERNPAAVSDGAGGVVVVFEAVARDGEHAGDAELAAQRLGPDGQRLWGQDGAPAPLAWSPVLEQHAVVVAP